MAGGDNKDFAIALRCFRKKEWRKAEDLFDKVLHEQPNHADALNLQGVLKARDKKHKAAIALFRKAIAIAPHRADYLANLGNALWERGYYEEAADWCRKSIELKPGDALAHNNLGNALQSMGELTNAEASYKQALRINPNYASAHNNLGNAYKAMGRNEDAVQYYRFAIQLNPEYTEAYNNLGAVLAALDKREEAVICLKQALKLDPVYRKAAENLWLIDPIWDVPLQSQKLILRRYQVSDAEFLYQCYHNDEFMERYHCYLPRYESLSALRKRLEHVQRAPAIKLESVDWVISRATGAGQYRPIGLANLTDIQPLHKRAELLIGLVGEKTIGVGLEASLLVLDFAFNKVGLNKLTSLVYSDNCAAQKSTLSLGFDEEGFLREHIFAPTKQCYLGLYANGMTKASFRENRRLSKFSKRLLQRDVTHATGRNAKDENNIC